MHSILFHYFLLVLYSHIRLSASLNVTVLFQTYFGEEYILLNNETTLKNIIQPENVYRIEFIGDFVVPSIQKNAISDFPNLKTLQIRQKGVEIIQPGAFENLPQIEALRLSSNKLKQIQDGVFNNLNVTFLNLDLNIIETISPNAFDNLPKLKVLDLSYNKLKEIHPNWLKNKPQLETVDFVYNEIEILPDKIFQDFHRSIYLSNNKIVNVSMNVFGSGRKVLGELALADNKIENLDENCLKDAKLDTFDISRNRIECLNGNFANFLVGFRNRIDGNPWKCECLERIKKWVEENKKIVNMKTSINNCNSTN